MAPTANLLRPTEAAVVSRVALRDVNRVVDGRILPDDFFTTDGGRHVVAAGCVLISFYFASARHLTSEERLFAIGEAGSRLHRFRYLSLGALVGEDWLVRDEFLTIDLAPFVSRTKERMDRLTAARGLVAIDPDVLGGTPVIRGTVSPCSTWRHPWPRIFRPIAFSLPGRRWTPTGSNSPRFMREPIRRGAGLDPAMCFPLGPSSWPIAAFRVA
jgi:hypothetical protein